ncbi:BCD family MFS transporter [Ramlibacter sp.]|uniref:BCD family MFS transporter n=1 Tax=Ramlibacter sp. TaxID=1917967 RepID=UPI003D0D93E5
MKRISDTLAIGWTRLSPGFLPFGDVLTPELPLLKVLRLSLFQITVGMAAALLIGTLNRVMIVELGVAAWLVAAMVALPLLFAPFRALVGFRSDTHRSALGWKRVPYIWMGTLIQFGGLSIMPFALILLSGDTRAPAWLGHASAALAFLMTGAGMQITQTAGLALATDQATEESRPGIVALMQVMLLVGMVVSGFAFGALLSDFSQLRLIQVVQGAAVVTIVVNIYALWKQEPRRPGQRPAPQAPRPAFRATWRAFASQGQALRLLVTVGLGTAAFTMQDIILEPYGGEILKLSVGATTQLTAISAGGALLAFALAAHWLGRGSNPYRIAAAGALVGIAAFAAVIFAAPLGAPGLFRFGAVLIGFGGGLFTVGTLTAAMALETGGLHGLALGAWGAVQASCAGVALALGGTLRDGVSTLALGGRLGEALADTATGYSFVYHLEIALLFATLVALGPLVRRRSPAKPPGQPFMEPLHS